MYLCMTWTQAGWIFLFSISIYPSFFYTNIYIYIVYVHLYIVIVKQTYTCRPLDTLHCVTQLDLCMYGTLSAKIRTSCDVDKNEFAHFRRMSKKNRTHTYTYTNTHTHRYWLRDEMMKKFLYASPFSFFRCFRFYFK